MQSDDAKLPNCDRDETGGDQFREARCASLCRHLVRTPAATQSVPPATPRRRRQQTLVGPTHCSAALGCRSIFIFCAAYRIVARRGPAAQAAADARVGRVGAESIEVM